MLLYALYILFHLLSIINGSCLLFLSTVLSNEDTGPPNQDDEQDPPAGMRTPPTLPPPSSPIPARVRAIAQLRPVYIPDIVRDIAGSNPQQGNILYVLLHLYLLYLLFLDIMPDSLMSCYMFHLGPLSLICS